MGASVRPDPVTDYLAALKPASDPVNEYLNALPAKNHDYHAEFASGALAKRMARANARDVQSAAEEDAAQPSTLDQKMTNALSVGQGIPGMEAVEAAAGSLGSKVTKRPIDYRQSLATLRGNTDQIDSKTRLIQKTLGGTAVMPFLPGSAAASGAILGAADQAFDADPDRGVGSRALGAAAGGIGGAVFGKGVEMAPMAFRAILSPKLGGTATPAANLFKRLADQSESAKVLYEAAKTEGKIHEVTPAITRFLAQEDIAPIVQRLQETTHQGVEAHSPEMLDALYKTLSDQAKSVEKGLAGPDPARVNTGRFTLQWIKDRQKQLVSAMGTPGTKTVTTEAPPITTAQSPAPDIRTALSDFWRRPGVAAQRRDGTVLQQKAREALERHGAENVVAPPLSGAPPGPRTIEETSRMPAYMPSYADAVQDFAKRASEMDALKAARIIAQKKITGAQIPANALTKKTPEALKDMVANPRNADNLGAMREGILGAAKEESGKGLGRLRRAASETPSLLRITADPTQAMLDRLARFGLLSANSSITP